MDRVYIQDGMSEGPRGVREVTEITDRRAHFLLRNGRKARHGRLPEEEAFELVFEEWRGF